MRQIRLFKREPRKTVSALMILLFCNSLLLIVSALFFDRLLRLFSLLNMENLLRAVNQD